MSSTVSGTSPSPTGNQTTSGPAASSERKLTADERLVELDRILDEYERSVGLPRLAGEDEVTVEARRIIDLPPAVLRKLSAVECAESAFVLGQYAHRLQQARNREQARVTWAEQSIRRLIASKVNNYKGVSFEERRLQAVKGDDAAQKLDAIRVKAQLRIDRVSFLADKANDLAKSLLSLKNAKQGVRE